MPREISPGVMAETVGDILDPEAATRPAPEFTEVESALEMPRIEGTAAEYEPGIWFDVPEEEYHRIPALSNSLIRYLLASPTIAWAKSWLNPDREEETKEHLTVGKAYHAMILEGPKAYESRFYPMPDKADYPDALENHADIKKAITDAGEKPIPSVVVDGNRRSVTKADHVAQLATIDPRIQVWDAIKARHEKSAKGRDLIPAADDKRIRIAARMIRQDPELAKAFTGGWPEVTLIWRDDRQGVLCKCRIDYLKLKGMVDLKSFANRQERSVRNSIIRDIAEHRYVLQPAHYLAGGQAVRELIRAHGASAIHSWPDDVLDEGSAPDDVMAAHKERVAEQVEWAMRWASFDGNDRWLWVFQQKGDAPVTRGFYHPLGGSVHSIAGSMIVTGLRQFRECVEIYGTDPWLDLAEIDELTDEDIPAWGLEI